MQPLHCEYIEQKYKTAKGAALRAIVVLLLTHFLRDVAVSSELRRDDCEIL